MKKLATLIRHSLIPLVLLLVLGCQKELVTTETDFLNQSLDSVSTLSIEEAKRYFDANFSSATIKKSHSHNAEQLFEHKSSKWGKAGYKQISFGDAVVVPLSFENLNLIIDKKTGAYVPYDQLNYLMMYKDMQKNVITEWVTLLPDSSWLHGKRDVYTGDIMVRTWEGKYLKMYRYSKDGQVKSFNINPLILQNSKISDFNAGTYTQCMRVRREENCTCINKYNCDMCNICAPEYCYTVTLVVEDPDPVGGGNTGGIGAGNTNNSGGSGGSYGSGSNYTPTCNPNIPPGTWVPSNQLPPCSPITPLIPRIRINELYYSTFEDYENDPFYQPFFEELNEAEKQFLRQHLNLVWSGARNYNETINYGNWKFNDSQTDNTNANAYKHLIWSGFNYISWDLGNNTNYAKTFGDLHELGPGTRNQHAMDYANNAAGINTAKNLPADKRNREGMSEAALNLMSQSNTPCRRLANSDNNDSELIKTDGTGRK